MANPVLVGVCMGCWRKDPESCVVDPYPGPGSSCFSEDCNHKYRKRRLWWSKDRMWYYESKQEMEEAEGEQT